MWISKYHYTRLRNNNQAHVKAYNKIYKQWNELVQRINDKGGEEFLSRGRDIEISDTGLQTLISLGHPDKHNNSERSNTMTQNLLKIKEMRKND